MWPWKPTDYATTDLDADWRTIDFSAIDIETTGLDLRRDEIISLGVANIHHARIKCQENFYREVRPRRLPSSQSIRIHGLRGIDLEAAAPLESTIPDFAAQIGGRVLIAHAAWIERAFLRRHLRGTGLTFARPMIDTAALARKLDFVSDTPDREPSLELLARRLGLPVYAPHNALGDALTTAVVFLALATRLERKHLAYGAPVLPLRILLETAAANAKH